MRFPFCDFTSPLPVLHSLLIPLWARMIRAFEYASINDIRATPYVVVYCVEFRVTGYIIERQVAS